MALRASLETLLLAFRDPFRIARAMDEGEEAVTVILELRDEDEDATGMPAGLGEGFPDAYYGETPETIAAVMPLLVGAVEQVVAGIADQAAPADVALALARAADAMDSAIAHHGAAKCAVDTALHDRYARRLGIPLHLLLDLP